MGNKNHAGPVLAYKAEAFLNGGIMEAANRGASDAGAKITGLPHEQRSNPCITPELGFEFHYFLCIVLASDDRSPAIAKSTIAR